ncbi:MAG: VWA domain-containing protein [Verrucomicrobiota bacterium]|jgi:uncharacterized protein YegL|nr:VWA domain-containing protein [Verrucomicrobiota bacterium]
MSTAAGIHPPIGREARLPWIRAALFALALVISVAAHALLFFELPGWLPLGASFKAPVVPRPRPLVMQEVRRLPDLPSYVQPEKFRPEDSEAFAEIEPLQQALLEGVLLEAEQLDFMPSAPQEVLIPAGAAEDFSRLDFRQDILQIERQMAEKERAALPRVVVPAVARISGVPDVVRPADADAIAEAVAWAEGAEDLVARPLAVLEAAEPAALAMIEAAKQGEQTAGERLREQGAFLDEKSADVTDLAPMEQLLDVHVATYRATEEEAVYFELSLSRAGVEALPVIPKDILLVQDCSESITRSKLDFFKEGIVAYLRTLTTADRLNVMRYSDTPVLCFEEWQPVTSDSLQEAVRFTDAMRARGQTDLFYPLQQMLKIPRHPGRPMIVVLMTDGRPTMGTVDSSEIIMRFSKANRGRVSVFTIGAGERVNSFLLDLLGHNNRGGAWIMPRREQIPAVVARAARELSRPVLANLEYRFSGDSAAEVYPATLTHLYLDRPLRLVGRCPLEQTSAVLQIVGDNGAQKRDMVFALDLATAENGGEGIRREWVAQKIYTLLNDHMISGKNDIIRDIHALSRRHNVPLPYGADFPK